MELFGILMIIASVVVISLAPKPGKADEVADIG